jgi:hypothetical protein
MSIATSYGPDGLGIEPRCGHHSVSCTVGTAFPFRGKVARASFHGLFYGKILGDLGSIMGRVTVPQAGWYGVRILVGIEYFSLLQIIQTGPEAHSSSYSMGTRVLSQDQSGRP